MFLLVFMSVTLAVSIFLARARKRRNKGESYLAFLMRDSRTQHKQKKKKRKVKGNPDLEKAMLERKGSMRSERTSRSKSHTHSKSVSRREKGEGEDDNVSGTARSVRSLVGIPNQGDPLHERGMPTMIPTRLGNN